MNAERHSECKRACRMPAPVLYAVCSREGQPGHWVVGPFRNGSEHTEWVGAFRTVYAFLDGSLNFLDWSLETGPSLRPVVCPSSESQHGHLQVDCSVTNWGASRAPSSRAHMGGSQSRVLTPRNLPGLVRTYFHVRGGRWSRWGWCGHTVAFEETEGRRERMWVTGDLRNA